MKGARHLRRFSEEIMREKDFKMPTFGVGPIYVFICFCLTVAGILLSHHEFLSAGLCMQGKFFFKVAGILSILFGAGLWIAAVIVEKINLKVRETNLITTGVYGVVRNPVYSAFIFVFTGALLFAANFLLLLLPIFYWGFLTVLMKKTEEKWLLRQFGETYATYCKEVNRVIPWPPKRKS